MNYVKNFNFYGTDAKEIPCVTGSGAPQPTTQGAVGLLYMDTDNGKVYKCTAVTNEISTWELLVSGGGGGENIQSDWNQKDESAPDYIKNRTHYLAKTLYYSTPAMYADDTTLYDGYTLVACGWINVISSDVNLVEGKRYVFENEYFTQEFVYTPELTGDTKTFRVDNILENGDETHLTIGYMIGETTCGIGFDYYTKSQNPTYVREGEIKLYRFETVPLDKEYLPGDVEYTNNKTNNWIDPTDDKYPTAKLVDSRFNECEKYTIDAYTAAQNAETLADDAKIAVDIVRERESMFAMITTSNANKIPLVFDTSKKTLTIYGDANTYVRVNKNLQYQFSSSQTIDLAYGNGYIVFDFSTNKFVLKPNNASSKASDGQALIAVYSNYGQSVSSHMKYSIDGHIYGINLDPMRETIEPKYEWLNVGVQYWSDFFIHDDILYVFIQSKYEDWSETADNAAGRIYLFDLSDLSTPKLTLKHNFGHCNTVHYCEQTDKLLIGNLPGNDTYKSALYIINNISGWKSLANNSFLDFNTIDKTIVDISGLKTIISTNDNIGNVAACWGANNIDRYDVVWCSTNYNTHWFKLLLGTGVNDLSSLENGGGTYNEADENSFNGTFLMLEHYKFDIPNGANTEVIQGIDYANGKVYTANGHNHMLGWAWDFSGGTVQRKTIKNTVQYPDGSIYSAISEGFCIYKGDVYHGYQEAQANSNWNDYPANPGTRLSGIMKYELSLARGDASGGGVDKKYVDDSIQSAILDSWEVAV